MRFFPRFPLRSEERPTGLTVKRITIRNTLRTSRANPVYVNNLTAPEEDSSNGFSGATYKFWVKRHYLGLLPVEAAGPPVTLPLNTPHVANPRLVTQSSCIPLGELYRIFPLGRMSYSNASNSSTSILS